MNYYEELGVSPQATPDEIHKAYRSAVKLMHPDRQLEPQIRDIAEKQMLRLNAMAQVLLNPEERVRYDQALFRSRFIGPAGAASRSVGAPWKRFINRKVGIPAVALAGVAICVTYIVIGNTSTDVYAAKRASVPLTPVAAVAPAPALSYSALAEQQPLNAAVLRPTSYVPTVPYVRSAQQQQAGREIRRNAQVPVRAASAAQQGNPTTRHAKTVLVVSLAAPSAANRGPIMIAPPPTVSGSTADAKYTPAAELPPAFSGAAPVSPIAPAVTTPVLFSRVSPVYPALARRARIQGVVNFEVKVDRDGRVRSARYLSGSEVLAESARSAIMQWQYRAATSSGKPVEAAIKVSVEFKLN